ncbi:hypothetical protein BU16DRAFT_135182 [Lophium mytilinum]|uniref:Uncharacterized protein n=1 Tax=Lophium mytilinum TaxID=390894 RepID=A0A6A6QH75_9PEZI|nr:hypothetical protein BU16DRAFT_135182 [Lophium mytilinum]
MCGTSLTRPATPPGLRITIITPQDSIETSTQCACASTAALSFGSSPVAGFSSVGAGTLDAVGETLFPGPVASFNSAVFPSGAVSNVSRLSFALGSTAGRFASLTTISTSLSLLPSPVDDESPSEVFLKSKDSRSLYSSWASAAASEGPSSSSITSSRTGSSSREGEESRGLRAYQKALCDVNISNFSTSTKRCKGRRER